MRTGKCLSGICAIGYNGTDCIDVKVPDVGMQNIIHLMCLLAMKRYSTGWPHVIVHMTRFIVIWHLREEKGALFFNLK